MIALKPSLKRFLLLRVPVSSLLLLCGSAVGFALSRPFDFEKWWPQGAGILLASLIGLTIYYASYGITLVNQEVGGNGRWSIWPTTIPLMKVDVAKSRTTETSVVCWLLGYYEIRSNDGKAISVDRLMFEQKQFEQLLNMIADKQQAAVEELVDQHAPHGQHTRPTRRAASRQRTLNRTNGSETDAHSADAL